MQSWERAAFVPNSDGDTGEFFRVKNYRREFFAQKPVGLNSQVLPSELTLERDESRRSVPQTSILNSL